MSQQYGKISQVIGPVVDVVFEGEGATIPAIYNALAITREDGSRPILEVEQHIGEDTVRCVAMESTDGLQRGVKVEDLGQPIAVPTGDQIKGRLLNVIGDAIDNLPTLDRSKLRPIHQPAPEFENLTFCEKAKKYFPRASKSLTYSSHTAKAARSDSSEAQA